MTRFYRILASLVPPPRSNWIKAHAAERDIIDRPLRRLRWALGALPLTLTALIAQLRHDPRSYLGSVLVRCLAAALSVLEVAAALALAIGFVATGARNPEMVFLAAGLSGQGSLTVLVLRRGPGRPTGRVGTVHVAFSAIVLVVGLAGLAASLIVNINPPGGDPEYGLTAVGALLAAQALASIGSFAGGGHSAASA